MSDMENVLEELRSIAAGENGWTIKYSQRLQAAVLADIADGIGKIRAHQTHADSERENLRTDLNAVKRDFGRAVKAVIAIGIPMTIWLLTEVVPAYIKTLTK